MPNFSDRSELQLQTAHSDLQKILRCAIQTIDFAVLEGYRSPERQLEMFQQGLSQKSSDGKHNQKPSQAVDIAPYPIDWKNTERFTLFAGFVLGIADLLGIKLRWGGDWNRNWDVKDEHFRDLGHFELMDPA